MNKHKRDGFTIVEIAITIVIIAILATIAIVANNTIQSQTRDKKRAADMITMKTKIDQYIEANGEPPSAGDDVFFKPLRDAGIVDVLDRLDWNYSRNMITGYCSQHIRWGGGEGATGPSCRNYAYNSGPAGTGYSDNGRYSTGCYIRGISSNPYYVIMRYDEASKAMKYYGNKRDVRVTKNADSIAFPAQVCELTDVYNT